MDEVAAFNHENIEERDPHEPSPPSTPPLRVSTATTATTVSVPSATIASPAEKRARSRDPSPIIEAPQKRRPRRSLYCAIS